MKKNSLKSILIKTTILTGTFLVGAAIGIVGMWQYTLHERAFGNNTLEADRLITDKIAIVNLDEGVIVQDEKVNYAEKLIIDLDENFLFTGLEDARQGYATGIYAGYLVVPATFSESIVSLNNTPVRAEVTYAINDKLREDVKEEVIYDVLTLMNELNDSVSYMYLHSVLDDFHTAQDEANKVMNNDLEEKEAINAVQAIDLIALVPVAEFTEIENNIVPVDISDYMAHNVELTSQVGLKYTEYLMASEKDHQKINEEAIALMDEMGNMSTIIGDVNFAQNEEGNSVYQEGTEELDGIFEAYNNTLAEKETEIGENILGIYKDINAYLTEYDRAIEVYQAENEESYIDTLTALEELFTSYQSTYVMVSAVEMQMIEDAMNAQNNQIIRQQNLIQELQSGGNTEESKVEISDFDTNGEIIKSDIMKPDAIEEDATEPDAIEPDTTEPDIAKPDTTESEIMESDKVPEQDMDIDSGAATETDESGKEFDAEGDVGTESSGMQLYVEKNDTGAALSASAISVYASNTEELSELQKEILKILEDNYYLFSGYLLDEEEEVVIDEDGNEVLITSLLEAYEYEKEDLENPIIQAEILEEQIGEIEKMDIGDVTTCIDEKILTPIQDNVENFVTAMMEQYAIEQEQLTAYNEAIMEYNPLEYINDEEIQQLTDEMLDNGTKLSEAILDTDIQQMEYVADVYAATREDLFTLQENIIQAKEDSDKAVEEGLQALKDTKNENSEENQDVLYDFSTKLPYTRLGSLEYVQAYEFMVNPVSTQNSETNERNVRNDSVKEESDSVNVQAKHQTDYQNISIIICAVICVIIVATTIKYHFHKKEESYEFD